MQIKYPTIEEAMEAGFESVDSYVKILKFIDDRVEERTREEVRRICENCSTLQVNQLAYKKSILGVVKLTVVCISVIMILVPVILYFMDLTDGIIWKVEMSGFSAIVLIVGVGTLGIKPKQVFAALSGQYGASLDSDRYPLKDNKKR